MYKIKFEGWGVIKIAYKKVHVENCSVGKNVDKDLINQISVHRVFLSKYLFLKFIFPNICKKNIGNQDII